MSDSAAQAPTSGEAGWFDAAFGLWTADPRLSAIVAPADAILLILDERAERVLHASPGAAALRAVIADAEGRLNASVGLSGQVRRLGDIAAKPRLVRIRFDGRGIAPPTTCLVASAPGENGAVTLVAPIDRLPTFRSTRSRTPAADDPPAILVPDAREPERPVLNRLIWRSDESDVIAQVAGARSDIVAALAGKPWSEACANAAPAESEALLAALHGRRTFRALPLTIRAGEPPEVVVLDVSGAPSGRANAAFTGFSGFAVAHAAAPNAQTPGIQTTSEVNAAQEIEPECDVHSPSYTAALPRAEPEPAAPALEERHAVIARFGGLWGGSEIVEPQPKADVAASPRHEIMPPEAVSDASVAKEPVEVAPALPAPADESESPDLSVNEHAAFREIARALGARFAGDEAVRPDAAEVSRGAVMPFPLAAIPPSSIASAVAAAFDRLPTGLFVRRDGTLLFANRRLLDMTGHADLAQMRAARGLDDLLGTGGDEPVSLSDGKGGTIRLALERSNLDWEGKPAEIVLTHPAPALEPEAPPVAPTTIEPVIDPRAMLDRLDDGVVMLDAQGRVRALNPKAEAILAEHAPDLVGRRLVGLPDAEPNAIVTSPATDESRAPSPATSNPLPLRERVARLLSSDEPLGPVVDTIAAEASTDAIRRSAESAARERLAFFARAGKEIRAPLSGILDVTDAMLDEQFGPLGSPQYRDYLHDIHASGDHALGLLDDLVDLVGIESGRIDLTFTDLPLNDLVSTCIAQMQPQAARERIVVRTSLSPDLTMLLADERSIRQAALNAIANAIRYTEPGGQVIVSTTLAERGEIALRVRDTGTGMTAEEIEQALEPYRQAGMPGSRRATGSGLGLTLTKALVEANRGRFRITSRKDEGTLVEMVFPSPRALSA